MSRITTPTSVVAEVNNNVSIREGGAEAELEPGTGCYVTEDADGNNEVHAAGAGSSSTRVVREQRNPPRGISGDNPLDKAYNAGDHTETVGFADNDKARLRLSENASAEPGGNEAAWDENGHITDDEGTVDGTDPAETFVGRIVRVVDRGDEDDFAVVEFK